MSVVYSQASYRLFLLIWLSMCLPIYLLQRCAPNPLQPVSLKAPLWTDPLTSRVQAWKSLKEGKHLFQWHRLDTSSDAIYIQSVFKTVQKLPLLWDLASQILAGASWPSDVNCAWVGICISAVFISKLTLSYFNANIIANMLILIWLQWFFMTRLEPLNHLHWLASPFSNGSRLSC